MNTRFFTVQNLISGSNLFECSIVKLIAKYGTAFISCRVVDGLIVDNANIEIKRLLANAHAKQGYLQDWNQDLKH